MKEKLIKTVLEFALNCEYNGYVKLSLEELIKDELTPEEFESLLYKDDEEEFLDTDKLQSIILNS
jgi:hypothetical protein